MRPAFVVIRMKPLYLIVACLLAAVLVGYLHDTARAPGQAVQRGPLSDIRIAVDPGHGGVDGGCNLAGFFEKDLNLAVGQALEKDLSNRGAAVRMTRSLDEALIPWGTPGGSRHSRDLAARVQAAKEFNAQVYLSLHANAGPSHLGGALTFYRKGDAESMRLAGLIQERLSKLVPGNQNGILPARFMVLTSTTVPAVLIEMGFITNAKDRAFLSSAEAPAKLAEGIAAGVVAFAEGEAPVAPTLSPYPAPMGDDPDWSEALPYPGCSVLQPIVTEQGGGVL